MSENEASQKESSLRKNIHQENDFDGWHIGKWKQSGTILFALILIEGWNLVVRWLGVKGSCFLEQSKVTRALTELEEDRWLNV